MYPHYKNSNSIMTTMLVLILLSTQQNNTASAIPPDNATTTQTPTPALTSVESYILLQQDILSRPTVKNKIPLSVFGDLSVSITFIPFKIARMDEVLQSMTMSSLIILSWRAYGLWWDPAQYANHGNLKIESSAVWTPAIVLPKSVEETSIYIEIPKVIQLFPNSFRVMIPTAVPTSCDLDLEYFPFDSHNCSVIFKDMWEYSITPHDDSVYTAPLSQHFSTTTEWELLDTACSAVQNELLKQNGEDFVFTECWVKIERRSLFYVMLVIVPIVTMDVMALFVFVIPPQAGEKVSFIVSIFVSLNIFNVYVNDVIPRSMSRVPLIIIFMGMVVFKVVLYMLATFFVLRRHEQQQQEQQQQQMGNNSESVGKEIELTPVENLNLNLNLKARNTTAAILNANETDSSINSAKFFSKSNQNKVGDHSVSNDARMADGRMDNLTSGFPAASSSKDIRRFKLVREVLAPFWRFCTSLTARQLDLIFFVVFTFANFWGYWYFISSIRENQHGNHMH